MRIINVQKAIIKFFTDILLYFYRISSHEVLDNMLKKALYFLDQNKNLLILKSVENQRERALIVMKEDSDNQEFWQNHIKELDTLKEKTIAVIQDNNSFYETLSKD